MGEYFELGSPCNAADFKYAESRMLLKACDHDSYTDVLECRVLMEGSSRTEIIVVLAGDGSVAHGNPGGIRRTERLAITINPTLPYPAIVRTLRKDFPPLSHRHYSTEGTPYALCLYNMPWSSVQRSWTAERFLDRLFWWLRESAELRLHRTDQPLEQLFYTSAFQLILPSNHLDFINDPSRHLCLHPLSSPPGAPRGFIAKPHTDEQIAQAGARGFRVLPLMVDRVGSSEVLAPPATLGQLQERLQQWGSELYSPLVEAVSGAVPSQGLKRPTADIDEGLLVLVWVPRGRETAIERYDVLCYAIPTPLLDLAQALDVVGPADQKGMHHRAIILGQHEPSNSVWKAIEVFPVEVRIALDAAGARKLSAIEAETGEFSAVLAGVGALGGLLAEIWAREGWGQWSYIDPDQLLPHNLCRHVGRESGLGQAKAQVLQTLTHQIYPTAPLAVAIAKSITSRDDDVQAVLSQASLLVDVTTTLDAPRELALRENVPRTASLFLTPSGQGCVLLMEDAERTLRTPALEAQYYRAILDNDWGQNHLAQHYGDIWVGGGCRDLSVKLAYERVALHAGILSRQMRRSARSNAARICVWQVDEDSEAVAAHAVPVMPVHTTVYGGWTVTHDDGLVAKLQQLRQAALPNETGGILLGVTDMASRSLVLVDVLTAPADSQASPCHFVRGTEGQPQALQEAQRRTAGLVDYVGDWHSHPDGCPARASVDDQNLLATLADRMATDGLPAVMLIVAEQTVSIYLQHNADSPS
ncbi:hypothetical protein IPC460_14195 [Pseudomonas aeruginosa]|nr:hypothetical protein IPC460_14195 [Pseudomonas aeruginosa]